MVALANWRIFEGWRWRTWVIRYLQSRLSGVGKDIGHGRLPAAVAGPCAMAIPWAWQGLLELPMDPQLQQSRLYERECTVNLPDYWQLI
jgi:hypothetical protein